MTNESNLELIKEYLFESFTEANEYDFPKLDQLKNFEFIKKDKYNTLIFYNKKDYLILELINESGTVGVLTDRLDLDIRKLEENKFKIKNAWDSDAYILEFEMKKFGINDYKLELNEKESDDSLDFYGDYEKHNVYDLEFTSNSDSAAFQLYFKDFIDRDFNDE